MILSNVTEMGLLYVAAAIASKFSWIAFLSMIFLIFPNPNRSGFSGKQCKCDLKNKNVDDEADLEDLCGAEGSNTDPCNGRGKCRCGQCQCDPGYVGKFCQCDRDKCPKGKSD